MTDRNNGVNCSSDVTADLMSMVGRPQNFGIPPESESPICGALEFTELYEYATVIHVDDDRIPTSGLQLYLGDDVASDGTSLWDDGAVALTPFDSISVALSELNIYVKQLEPNIPHTLGALDDVDLATASPSDGDALVYREGAWQAETPIPPVQTLAGLEDVDLSTASPQNGDVLTQEDGVWVPKTPRAPTLEALEDVDVATAAPQNGDVLTQEDGVWVPKTPVTPDSEHILLGTNTGDGNWADGALSLDPSKTVGYAIDGLNGILGLLVPAQPPAFPNSTALSVSNSAGNNPLLASGVTDNSGTSSIVAGGSVTRITASSVNSNLFNDVGPGKTGTVSLLINGSVVGSHVLTGTGDNGNYAGLLIADEKDYPPATPGFWKSIDVSVSGAAVSQGVNKFQITHTAAGNTGETYFVRDNLNTVPTISSASVTEATAGTYAYSSSIPHYGTGGQLTVAASYNNLSGETYYGGSDPFTISGTNSIITTKTYTYANLGISTPIARQQTGAHAISNQVVDVDGSNVHNSGVIQGVAKNVAGSSSTTNLASTIILVKRGSAGSRLDENSITVSGLGSSPNSNNAVRVAMGSGDKPALSSKAAWTSSASIQTYDATIVAGVAKHDQTNYSTGYLPAGVDLSSGRSGAQYLTFSFQRSALSAFKINITGTYAGCWVALPGVSDAQPNGGGWWDMFQSYDGSGIPGETGDTVAGCALGSVMTGASGSFQATFGTASSTNSTGNEILVHIKLTAGQSVTALSFTN